MRKICFSRTTLTRQTFTKSFDLVCSITFHHMGYCYLSELPSFGLGHVFPQLIHVWVGVGVFWKGVNYFCGWISYVRMWTCTSCVHLYVCVFLTICVATQNVPGHYFCCQFRHCFVDWSIDRYDTRDQRLGRMQAYQVFQVSSSEGCDTNVLDCWMTHFRWLWCPYWLLVRCFVMFLRM